MLTKLFPGSRATTFRRHDNISRKMVDDKRVLPVKRKGLWGYAENVWLVPVGDDYVLAFELHMAAIERGAVAGWAKDKRNGPEKYQQMIAVVLVDAQGKFKAKPAGFPLIAEVISQCMGDLCVGQGAALRSLNLVEGNGNALWFDMRLDGTLRALGLMRKGDALMTSQTLHLGSVDDLSGCDMSSNVQMGSYKNHDVYLHLRDHCNPEACPDECGGRGIRSPAKSSDREVRLEGMH